MLRTCSRRLFWLFGGKSSANLSSEAPLSHFLGSQATLVAQPAHQEWTSGHGTGPPFFNNGSFAAGMLLAAASPIALAQAEERSSGSIPVSETATHPLDDEAITNEHTAKMSMARIAALEYYQAGKYELAERKFKEAVEESILGFESKDPHVASAKNNLAEFYRNTGQHKKAEQLYKEALDLLESAFGEKHWLYVSAMHNLALSYEAIGDLAAAKEAMEHVMRWGVAHPCIDIWLQPKRAWGMRCGAKTPYPHIDVGQDWMD
ncbi:hypothetical protein DUNSADRAFT_8695 [Dunaliella salina]|uniref:Tetratricopeptide repeat protein n=1 Tax=Dunaliella salina TaxID=3046 RepID=A0ABQ7GJ30_DUNSA|nr:hypothetical protein DUNSADRAFT_8695 [Dunaliella salina]|eukprot:KAF5834610.1 hypothetical protein DUNSADRAFT_8695 [Dunaliella salina]